jgi:hypothetical protein
MAASLLGNKLAILRSYNLLQKQSRDHLAEHARRLAQRLQNLLSQGKAEPERLAPTCARRQSVLRSNTATPRDHQSLAYRWPSSALAVRYDARLSNKGLQDGENRQNAAI